MMSLCCYIAPTMSRRTIKQVRRLHSWLWVGVARPSIWPLVMSVGHCNLIANKTRAKMDPSLKLANICGPAFNANHSKPDRDKHARLQLYNLLPHPISALRLRIKGQPHGFVYNYGPNCLRFICWLVGGPIERSGWCCCLVALDEWLVELCVRLRWTWSRAKMVIADGTNAHMTLSRRQIYRWQ